MSIEKLRLFVAVTLPRAVLDSIDKALAAWRPTVPGARWIPVENQHVTLKFLGSTPAERLDAVRAVCAIVAADHEPAEITATGLGAFPGVRRARVVWVGLDDPSDVLGSAARALSDGFEPLGYPAENRPFRPHLTLARLKVPGRLNEPLPDLPPSTPFTIDALELFRSRLHPKGARYEMLESFRLGK